jgi:outer membrane lipoprotein SlyB
MLGSRVKYVKGVIVGGINGVTINEFLGYEIGVAITGHEDVGLTLIITEGFGRMRMSDRTFNLLKKNEGKRQQSTVLHRSEQE